MLSSPCGLCFTFTLAFLQQVSPARNAWPRGSRPSHRGKYHLPPIRATLRSKGGVGGPLASPCQASSQIERPGKQSCLIKSVDRASAPESPTRIGRCKMTVDRPKWANYRVGPDLQRFRSPGIPAAFCSYLGRMAGGVPGRTAQSSASPISTAEPWRWALEFS